MTQIRKKAAVGLSGGVDSAVAAAILVRQGYDVTGITMSIWDGSMKLEEGPKHACYGPGEDEEIETAAKISEKLGVPYRVFDLKKEYQEEVIQYFRREYLAGRTPNPCVMCNYRMKFGFLLEKARLSGLEFDYFATGHYARIVEEDGNFFIKKALDGSKDQTYFLQGLRRELLGKIIFPLGEMTKPMVREEARRIGLEVAERPESQDFIAGGDYSQLFANDNLKEGDIVDESGRVLGRHKGIVHYTVGQRKGLGISNETPLYVLMVDPKKNRVVVTDKEHLFSKGLTASSFNLLIPQKPDNEFRAFARIRQKHKEAPATVTMVDENNIKIIFDEPQLSITPGQAVALYDGDILIGGGIIEEKIK